MKAAWRVKEQLQTLLATGSLADAVIGKDRLQGLVERAAQPETNRLWRTTCGWRKEIDILIVTGATTAKLGANNTAIKHIKRTVRGFTNARNYKTLILFAQCRQDSGMNSHQGRTLTMNCPPSFLGCYQFKWPAASCLLPAV
jgi:hypothetical protein